MHICIEYFHMISRWCKCVVYLECTSQQHLPAPLDCSGRFVQTINHLKCPHPHSHAGFYFFYSNQLRLFSSLKYVLTHMNHFNSNTAFFHSRSFSHMRVRVKAPPDLNSSPHLTQSCVLRATRLHKEFLKSRKVYITSSP